MRHRTSGYRLSVLLGGLLLIPLATAHPATERYIPIGQSPGMSGEYTHTGKIRKVDDKTHTLTVETDDGERYEAKVTPESEIWLDRSKSGRTSLGGDYDDCRKGRRVEIKYVDGRQPQIDWMKIEAR